jgi:hypothetical protein
MVSLGRQDLHSSILLTRYTAGGLDALVTIPAD